MPLLDFVSKPTQRVAYLFPETTFHPENPTNQTSPDGGFVPESTLKDVFVFQFWPNQVQDNYTPNYATKNVPGGSHPIYQWTSGSGREISFTAQFVSEVVEDNGLDSVKEADFRSRITSASAGSPLNLLGKTPGIGPLLLPSARYTTNVSAALAALQQYLYPTYVDNAQSGKFARPPKKLILVLPGTNLGRKEDDDGILCIMRGASVTMESWFPSGELRAASVALRFSEIVQRTGNAGEVSSIRYIGATEYRSLAQKYTATIQAPKDLAISI